LYGECVIDIGGSRIQETLKKELQRKLLWSLGRFQKHRLLPASVLHDDVGLTMWQSINRLPEYYQTRDEIELLKRNGQELAQYLEDGVTLVDLGSGYVILSFACEKSDPNSCP